MVVTKDRDFRDSHLLTGSPRRLLVVATGNITNSVLLGLFEEYVQAIVAAFDEADYVELGPKALFKTMLLCDRQDCQRWKLLAWRVKSFE